MTKKMYYLSAILGVMATTAIVAAGTYAYQGDQSLTGPQYSEERHDAMITAFENKDYEAWKSQMAGRGHVSQVINQGNFNRFTEMHNLMLEGKTEEANVIRQELGLGTGNKQGNRQGSRGSGFTDKNGNGVCDMME